MVAAIAWVWQHGRRIFPIVVLTIGVGVLAYVLYDTFSPFPPAPFDWVVVAAGISTAAGLLIAVAPGMRARLAASELLRATRRLPHEPVPDAC